MDKHLQERADAAIAAYREEIDEWEWSAVPIWTARSRERLTSFIAMGVPEYFIESEIDLLYQKIKAMKKARLK